MSDEIKVIMIRRGGKDYQLWPLCKLEDAVNCAVCNPALLRECEAATV